MVVAWTNADARPARPAGRSSAGAAVAPCAGTFAYAGVAATLSVAAAPTLVAGHVAAWVGVGGGGIGPSGTDAWIQAGLNAYPDGINRYRFRDVAALGTRWRPLTDVGLIERRGYGVTRTGSSFVAASRF